VIVMTTVIAGMIVPAMMKVDVTATKN
jgi:hypothetical protein